MHDAYTIGIPVLVTLLANTMNRSELKDFRSEMKSRLDKMQTATTSKFEKMQDQMDHRFNDVDRRFDAIDAELRYFHGVTGKLDGCIEAIEKRN